MSLRKKFRVQATFNLMGLTWSVVAQLYFLFPPTIIHNEVNLDVINESKEPRCLNQHNM